VSKKSYLFTHELGLNFSCEMRGMKQSTTSFGQIIFVEDEPSFREMISQYFQKKGYEVMAVSSAIDFYKEFNKKQFALAIIDVGLPDQNGLIVVKYIRANSTTHIILLTDTSLDARIAGYEAGADIYLTKPVNSRLFDAALGSTLMRVAELTFFAKGFCLGLNSVN
jgi:DNA-binding response OmpR family regulator